MTELNCKNCAGTGWTSSWVPTAKVAASIQMREVIGPCHLCNASSWKEWAQNFVAIAQNPILGDTIEPMPENSEPMPLPLL